MNRKKLLIIGAASHELASSLITRLNQEYDVEIVSTPQEVKPEVFQYKTYEIPIVINSPIEQTYKQKQYGKHYRWN